MKYDYYEAVTWDVKNYITDNYENEELVNLDRDRLEEDINDAVWTEDLVTGNGYCGYFDTEEEARDVLDLQLLSEAVEALGCGWEFMAKGWRACDATIRCYVLGSCISKALDEILEEIENED